MSCCKVPAWSHLIATGALDETSVRAALPAPVSKPGPAIGPIDTILLDATFLLAEPTVSGERVTAVALSGNTIADVGDATRIIKRAPDAKRVSLGNTTIAPGFVEAHAHIVAAPQNLYMVDLGHNAYATFNDVYVKIQNDVSAAPTGKWLFYQGFDPSLLGWTEDGFNQLGFAQFQWMPNQENVNIFVQNASGHIAYANATAFNTALKTSGDLPLNPPGGSYQVVNGALTGIMFEPPSFAPFLKFAPPSTPKEIVHSMVHFLGQAQAAGVTTLADPAVGLGGQLSLELDIYAFLAGNLEVPTDVVGSLDLTSVYPPGSQASGLLPPELKMPTTPGGTGSYYGLTIPAVKLWADGTTQGYTAYLWGPYLPPVTPAGLGQYGAPDWTLEEMKSFVSQAKLDNWSLLIHANGDRAITMALDTIEQVYGAKSGFRARIEHCTVTTSDQYDRMQRLGVTPTYLNNHVYIWGDSFNEYILGNARASRLDCASEAANRDMIFSFHCDYSVSMPEPLRYMQTAVTRKTSSGVVLGSEYAITALEALKGVTIYPAQQLGIDATVGTITAGKLANLVNLQLDPTTCQSDVIASIPVLGTYLRGQWLAVGPATK